MVVQLPVSQCSPPTIRNLLWEGWRDNPPEHISRRLRCQQWVGGPAQRLHASPEQKLFPGMWRVFIPLGWRAGAPPACLKSFKEFLAEVRFECESSQTTWWGLQLIANPGVEKKPPPFLLVLGSIKHTLGTAVEESCLVVAKPCSFPCAAYVNSRGRGCTEWWSKRTLSQRHMA